MIHPIVRRRVRHAHGERFAHGRVCYRGCPSAATPSSGAPLLGARASSRKPLARLGVVCTRRDRDPLERRRRVPARQQRRLRDVSGGVSDEWVAGAGAVGDAWDFVLARVAIDFRRELARGRGGRRLLRARADRQVEPHAARGDPTPDGELAAEAEAVLVARDRERGRSRPLTEAERSAFERARVGFARSGCPRDDRPRAPRRHPRAQGAVGALRRGRGLPAREAHRRARRDRPGRGGRVRHEGASGRLRDAEHAPPSSAAGTSRCSVRSRSRRSPARHERARLRRRRSRPARAPRDRDARADRALRRARSRAASTARRGRSPSRAQAPTSRRSQATAVRDGDDWVLNGEKWFVTSEGEPGFYVVLAVAEGEQTLFLVDPDAPGLEIRRTPRFLHDPYLDHHPEIVFTRLPRPRREPRPGERRRGSEGVVPRRAALHRRPLLRRGAAARRPGGGLGAGARGVRRADRRVPGRLVPARGLAHRAACRAAADLPRGARLRRARGPQGRARQGRDGQALRVRDGRPGRRPCAAGSSAVAATWSRTLRRASTASSGSTGSGRARARSSGSIISRGLFKRGAAPYLGWDGPSRVLRDALKAPLRGRVSSAYACVCDATTGRRRICLVTDSRRFSDETPASRRRRRPYRRRARRRRRASRSRRRPGRRPDADTITVYGIGTVKAVPDEARFASASKRAPTAQAAVAANADAMREDHQRASRRPAVARSRRSG